MVKPTDSELEILNILWKHGRCSVRTVNEHLSSQRDVGYTTTLKLMQIMHEKGLVDRDTSQRSHIYKALVKERDVKENLLNKFMYSAFEGSASQLILQALGNHKMTDHELQEIRHFIDKLEEE